MNHEKVLDRLKEIKVYLPPNSYDITLLHHEAGSLEIGARHVNEYGQIITTQRLVLTPDNRSMFPGTYAILDELGLPEQTIEDEPGWAPL